MGKTKSQKFDMCPMNSHFIGLGLLRTVFEIALARREGPAPAFSCIAGDIAGRIPKNWDRDIWLFGYLAACDKHARVGYP